MTVTLPASEEIDIRPQHYQRLTEKIAGKPEERILSYLMLRSLKQARYAADLLGHFALAAQEYTHFTSPIRRYPDLIVHRVLKWALENPDAEPPRAIVIEPRTCRGKDRPVATLGPYRRVELEEIASESSESERRADAAERELMEWKTAQFMESHLGEEYDALIISVQKFGFFVELMEIFVEGPRQHRPARGNHGPALRVSRPRSRDRHRAASRLARQQRAASDLQARRSRARSRRTHRSHAPSRRIFACLAAGRPVSCTFIRRLDGPQMSELLRDRACNEGRRIHE